jgi:hypothetical protein
MGTAPAGVKGIRQQAAGSMWQKFYEKVISLKGRGKFDWWFILNCHGTGGSAKITPK